MADVVLLSSVFGLENCASLWHLTSFVRKYSPRDCVFLVKKRGRRSGLGSSEREEYWCINMATGFLFPRGGTKIAFQTGIKWKLAGC
jgi:hypothetical protein